MSSRAIPWGLLGCGVTLLVAGAFACGSPPSPQTAQAASAPPSAATAPTTEARGVTAVVLMNGCAHFGVANARLAQSAIDGLVDGCTSLAADRVQFTATLLPGGAIQFEPGPKDSTAIPLCVLAHPLTHRVQLQKACSLDVRLEQTSVLVPKSADAGP
jgi:hypothetical protein